MEKRFVTKNVEERNALIVELYHKGVVYSYTDANNEVDYFVDYDTEITREN